MIFILVWKLILGSPKLTMYLNEFNQGHFILDFEHEFTYFQVGKDKFYKAQNKVFS